RIKARRSRLGILHRADGFPAGGGVAGVSRVDAGRGDLSDLDGVGADRSIGAGTAATAFGGIPIVAAPGEGTETQAAAKSDAHERIGVRASAQTAIGDPTAAVAIKAVVDFGNEMNTETKFAAAECRGPTRGQPVMRRRAGAGHGVIEFPIIAVPGNR